MYRVIIFQAFLLVFLSNLNASTITGHIQDSNKNEELIGARILIKELQSGTISGLDGTYLLKNIPKGNYTIVCSYVGYTTLEKKISLQEGETIIIDFLLIPQTTELDQVIITGKKEQNTDISARISEKISDQVINVISAKTIELSPDLTVGNVIQRVSGVTMERNASGDAQYAILRGMDKRFNYTMVNGMKIPSPDNKNRFVPLDIFPSELLDRLEVSKSITADMEGDGIGGAVNMIMKDAPQDKQLTANLATGYNMLFLNNKYQYFDVSAINLKSPSESYGLAYPVQIKDFSTKNLHLNSMNALPNLTGGFSYGNRFLKSKLGIIVAASYQNNVRGNSSNIYSTTIGSDGQQIVTDRFFSNKQTRMGLHSKIDYNISPNSRIMLYNAYLDFQNSQVRDAVSNSSQTTRFRWNKQTIFNSTLKGVHNFNDLSLYADWALSYGKAFNITPDNVQINSFIVNGINSIDQNDGASRRWEHNSDEDRTVNFNLRYTIRAKDEGVIELSSGGLYRNKIRGSYFNEYHFKPYDESKTNPRELIKGKDFSNFDETKFSVNSFGNLSDPLNYSASEKISAGYLMGKFNSKTIQFICGVRIEYTNQGYLLKFTTEGARNNGSQKYADVLPSLSLKFSLHKDANIHITYSKGINRPSFFEIIPYSIIYEDYKERGNPDLKHTTADNYDLRYEYFPRPSEQIMAGIFYKKIKNPIEYGMMNGFGQDVFYMPMNFGNANNSGFELDFIKYFSWFGIKANYTYTKSHITTSKMRVFNNPDPNAETNIITEYVEQTRSLFGQAANVANISLLIKGQNTGWDAQLAFSYTGDRLVIVSRYLNEDTRQAGYGSVDASVEKRFESGLTLFAKASNLLNSPMIQYNKPNDNTSVLTSVERYKGGIVERKEFYGQNISLGIRIKFQ